MEASGSREVRGTGGYSQPVRVDTGERLADGGCTCAVPVVVEEPSPTRARRLSRCRIPTAHSHLACPPASSAVSPVARGSAWAGLRRRDPHGRRPFQRGAVLRQWWSVDDGIAGAAVPSGGPPPAVSQAGPMPDGALVSAEPVAVRAAGRWPDDPLAVRGLHQLAQHARTAYESLCFF